MINVKQIAKPKSGSASSGGGASGVVVKTTEEAKYAAKAGSAEYAEQAKYADSAGYSSRAAYADSAGDIADGSPVYDKFLRKDIADTASGLVTLNKGLALGNTGYGVDGSGNATLNRVSVNDKVTTPDFVDGLAGEGFRLWKEKGLTYLTLDKLTVRQTMSVFEMLINKIRSVGGQICVSAANGKIKSVTYSSGYYFITFEDENQFQLGDLVRCQTFTGGTVKSYWVTVASVMTLTEGGQAIGVNESDFNGAVPEVGDECVLMGNTDNLNRQSLVLISAAEDGKPRVDVLNGVKSTDAVNTLRARLGKLDGIESSSFPEDNQPSGDGLYADNAYLKGTFILSATGEDVATRFTITENGIKSKVESVRSDFQAEGNYLDNPAFLSGLDKWDYGTAATAFTTGNSYIWANDNVLTHDGEIDVVEDGERQTVKMKNMYLTQLNADMKNKPDTTADGKAVGVTLSFRYKCTAAGTLSAHLTSSDASVLGVIQELAVTDGYETFTVTGLWYGTEDLTIAFSGEIYIAMISLRPDSGNTLASKYSTLFAQSDKLVNIAAANYDDNGGVLEKSEIMTTSKYNTLISEKFDSDGRLKNTAGLVTTTDAESFVTTTEAQNTLKNYMKTESFSGMFAAAVDENNIVKKADISAFVSKDSDGNLESGVKVTADNIQLEGLTTINEHFTVKTNGDISAINATFTNATINGTFRSPFKQIRGSWVEQANDNLYTNEPEGEGHLITTLPWTAESIGRRFTIVGGVVISAPDGKYFYEDGRKMSVLRTEQETVELLGYGYTSETEGTFLGWIVMNRINFVTTNAYGRPVYPLAFGRVKINTDGCSLDENSRAFDQSAILVDKKAVGVCRLRFPKSWFADTNRDCMAVVTGISTGSKALPVTAGVVEFDTDPDPEDDTSNYDHIYVSVMKGGSLYDGTFRFILYNRSSWVQNVRE